MALAADLLGTRLRLLPLLNPGCIKREQNESNSSTSDRLGGNGSHARIEPRPLLLCCGHQLLLELDGRSSI